MKRKMASSIKKFIRREKSRIRRQILDPVKQKEAIKKIYENI